MLTALRRGAAFDVYEGIAGDGHLAVHGELPGGSSPDTTPELEAATDPAEYARSSPEAHSRSSSSSNHSSSSSSSSSAAYTHTCHGDRVMDGGGYRQRPTGRSGSDEEGVEVVLAEQEMGGEGQGSTPGRPPSGGARRTPDQNVFRAPSARTVKPQAVRAPGSHPYMSTAPASGSYGAYPAHHPPSTRPPPPTAPPEYGAPPYPVPYGPSRSFEEASSSYRPGSGVPEHYSPHLQYPPPPRPGPGDDVNVISPSHKSEHGYRPAPASSIRGRPSPPRPPSYYQYPPPSPVSRPEAGAAAGGGSGPHGNSPPRLLGYSSRGREHPGPYPVSARMPRRPGPTSADEDRDRERGVWNPSPYSPPTTAAPTGAAAAATATPPIATPGQSREPGQPPVVASSFDSGPYSSRHSRSSHPTPATPGTQYTHSGTPMHDPHQRGYGSSSYGTSFESQTPPHGHPPPPHFDDSGYYGRSAHPPGSPYSHSHSHYSSSYGGYPGGPGSYSYSDYSPHPDYHRSGTRPPAASYSHDDSERHGHRPPYYHHPYPPHHHPYPPYSGMGMPMPPAGGRKSSNSSSSSSSMLLPEAAREVDFDVTSPPSSPITKPSDEPACKSPAEVNNNDVLCGRGGGTNSQIGNRKFRKLVQDFQPTYLLARRKEKPLLARTIVLIIRKRGGRFLKKNEETGEMFEVGDSKAEAKTSQALREGLDVRSARSAAGGLLDRKKKKAASKAAKEEREAAAARQERYEAAAMRAEEPSSDVDQTHQQQDQEHTAPPPARAESPPSIPRLQESRPAGYPGHSYAAHPYAGHPYTPGRPTVGMVHPQSPEALQLRKRRRMRSGDNSASRFMGGLQDKLFPDFCPPRADLARGSAPLADDSSVTDRGDGNDDNEEEGVTTRSYSGRATRQGKVKAESKSGGESEDYEDDDDDDDIRAEKEAQTKSKGCVGIALDIATGAASQSFCLGPRFGRSSSK